MKKRIFSTILAGAIFMVSPVSIFASSNQVENNHFEFLVPKNQIVELQNLDPITKEEMNQLFNKFENEFNSTITQNDRLEAEQIVKELAGDEYSISSSDYDQYYNELRKGNYIEGVLDRDEGLSALDITKIGFIHANTAREEALKKYPNDVMLRDAYRHFTWNYIATKDVGAIKTRTATINHEWGIILLNPVLNYYNNR
ncbi:hypothetical protein CHH67_24055, partial [Paenibacillus campinasensis]